MLELAARFDTKQPVRIRDIADRHGIPSRFLVQILLQLKSAGYVNSTRGAAGGYRLAKRPTKITLGQVMRVIDGHDEELVSNTDSDSDIVQVLLDTWSDVARSEQEQLDAVTLADLLEQAGHEAEPAYYI